MPLDNMTRPSQLPLAGLAFTAVALIAFIAILQRPTVEARFLFQPGTPTALNPAAIETHDLKADTPSAHSASITRLKNGERVAYWFAGSREGARDVKVFSARYANGTWSQPRPVASPLQTMRDEWRFVRKVGNPVAVEDQSGRLHLFYVSVSLGGWATSQINQMTSHDGGHTFGPAKLIVSSPFLNISTLIRTPAVQRADGGFDLPAYHEIAKKFPELLRFSASGEFIEKIRLHAKTRALQPAIVATSEHNAIALQRDGGPDARIVFQQSSDGGTTWDAPQNLDLVNPNSAVALARFDDGELLLAYNPNPGSRSELALATSIDGKNWIKRRSIEQVNDGSAAEFSYPSLLIEGQTVDLVYTWHRRHIRHVRFNRNWLNTTTETQP